MKADISLTGQFLVAMPGLRDPNFFHAVTYLCEHDEQGAMGIVINRPMSITLNTMLERLDMQASSPAVERQAVYLGGPVQQERGFVLHSTEQQWASTLTTSDEISVTVSKDILRALADDCGPKDCLVSLGYCGWSPGQLEDEIANNCWLNVPASAHIIFSVPVDQRWSAAAALLGVDVNSLHNQAGHA